MRGEGSGHRLLRASVAGRHSRQTATFTSTGRRVVGRTSTGSCHGSIRRGGGVGHSGRDHRERVLDDPDEDLRSRRTFRSRPPTCVVPVATQVGRITRNRHHVSEADRNVAVAARAHVALGGLVRLDPAHFHRAVQTVPDGEFGPISQGRPRRRARSPRRWRRPRRRSRRGGPGTSDTG